jgi:hypothetical protein
MLQPEKKLSNRMSQHFLSRSKSGNGFVPPLINIHSSNSAAVQRMEAAKKKIFRIAEDNEKQGRKWNGSLDLPLFVASG